MQSRELEEMFALEQTHWWYVGKRMLFESLLADRLSRPRLRVLDAGCGTGAIAVSFERFGRVWTLDRSRHALAFARSRGVDRSAVSDGTAIPFRDDAFDLVLALDVIEHVEDDRGMLCELARVLRPDGVIAIHVPAWPFLWSGHDEALEHKRRYTRRGLRRVLGEAGLEIERLGWTNTSIFFPAVAARLVGKRTARSHRQDLYELPPALNATMIGVYRLESAVARTVGLPIGLSLAAIAKRRG